MAPKVKWHPILSDMGISAWPRHRVLLIVIPPLGVMVVVAIPGVIYKGARVVCHAGDRSWIGAPDAMEQMRAMAWRVVEDGAKTGRWHKWTYHGSYLDFL